MPPIIKEGLSNHLILKKYYFFNIALGVCSIFFVLLIEQLYEQ